MEILLSQTERRFLQQRDNGCSGKYAGWPLSVLRSAGVTDVRTGTWCSASWRSCSPTVLPADPWLQNVPADGPAFTPAACIPPRTPGPPAAKGLSPPPVHFSPHLFLTLSNFAYTKFYTRPTGPRRSRGTSDCCRSMTWVLANPSRPGASLTPFHVKTLFMFIK